MKYFVTAKPRSREEKVERIDETHLIVSVKEPPIDGKANKAILKVLGLFLDIAPSRLYISSGHFAKYKTIEVD